jgi:hypothetical protein
LLDECSSEHIFVASLSLSPDDLVQWKSYAKNGDGACIELIITKQINEEAIKESLKIFKTVYRPKDKKFVLNKIVELHYDQFLKENDDVNHYDYIQSMYRIMAYHFPLFKHKAFKDEKEVRIIYYEPDGIPKNLQFKISNGFISPYVSLKDIIRDFKLPICGVIAGPAVKHAELTDSIEYLLRAKKYSNVSVEHSKIPYRG